MLQIAKELVDGARATAPGRLQLLPGPSPQHRASVPCTGSPGLGADQEGAATSSGGLHVPAAASTGPGVVH